MKKITLIFFALFAMKTSFSQTEKGNKFVGGNFNFYGANQKFIDSTLTLHSKGIAFNIIANCGYFIKNNFAVGLSANYGVTNSEIDDILNTGGTIYTIHSTSSNYGAGVFGIYFYDINDNFKLFLNSSLNYQAQTFELNAPNHNVYSSMLYDVNTTAITVSPGITYFANKKLGIQASIGKASYGYSTAKNINATKSTIINSYVYSIQLNPSTLYFGVNYYF